jgi:hypothetical protein
VVRAESVRAQLIVSDLSTLIKKTLLKSIISLILLVFICFLQIIISNLSKKTDRIESRGNSLWKIADKLIDAASEDPYPYKTAGTTKMVMIVRHIFYFAKYDIAPSEIFCPIMQNRVHSCERINLREAKRRFNIPF